MVKQIMDLAVVEDLAVVQLVEASVIIIKNQMVLMVVEMGLVIKTKVASVEAEEMHLEHQQLLVDLAVEEEMHLVPMEMHLEQIQLLVVLGVTLEVMHLVTNQL